MAGIAGEHGVRPGDDSDAAGKEPAVMRPDVLCRGVLCYNMIDELYERERKKR